MGTAHRGFEHLRPQVAYALVEFVGEDRIAVIDEETVGIFRWDRIAHLLHRLSAPLSVR
jgi:hypothetical protein